MKQTLFLIAFMLSGICISRAQTFNVTSKEGDRLSFEITDKESAFVALQKSRLEKDTLTVPESVEYEGKTYTVTEIADLALSYNWDVKAINLPPTLTRIGEGAFTNCQMLAAITIPENVNEIGIMAFMGCENIKEIKFPDNLETIEQSVCSNCRGLQNVTLGKNTTEIKKDAFMFCNMTSISIPAGVQSISSTAFQKNPLAAVTIESEGGINVTDGAEGVLMFPGVFVFVPEKSLDLYRQDEMWSDAILETGSHTFAEADGLTYLMSEKGWAALVAGKELYSGELILPASASDGTKDYEVTYIANGAFDNSSLSSLYLPESLTDIYCSLSPLGRMEALYLGHTTPPAKDWNFTCAISVPEGCLETYMQDDIWHSKNIVEGTPEYIETEGMKFLVGTGKNVRNRMAILTGLSATDMTSITVPETVSYDGNTYPVGKIAGSCFKYNFYLETAQLPSGITHIGDQAFESSGIKEISLPATLKYIGKNAFSMCRDLTSVAVPESVSEIRDGAFYGCSSLESVTLPSGLATISENMFNSCSALQEITLPAGVSQIGKNAFAMCRGLKRIDIPQNVTRIEDNTFMRCEALEEVSVPEALQFIGRSAFEGCVKLGSFTFPASLTHIGGIAFNETALNEITLPENISYIGENAFSGIAIEAATIKAETPPTLGSGDGNNTTFDKSAFDTRYIIVPDKALDSYLGDKQWNMFNLCSNGDGTAQHNGIVYILRQNGMTAEVVMADTTLTEISIENTLTADGKEYTVTKVGAKAFYNNLKLQKITLPESVKEIKNMAFCYDANLREVIIPASAEVIGDYAFAFCERLKSASLPANLKQLGKYSFAYCSSIKEANVPAGITEIEEGVFTSCYSLEKVQLPENITAIGAEAFSFCDKMTEINIPETLRSIGFGAFGDCQSLTQFTLPESLTEIGAEAFMGCVSLTELYSNPVTPPAIDESVFYMAEPTVYVPCDREMAYIEAPVWNSFDIYEYLKYKLTVKSCEDSFGYAEITCQPDCGTPAEVTATANPGYVFKQWSDGSEDNPHSFILSEDTELTAIFVMDISVEDAQHDADITVDGNRITLPDEEYIAIYDMSGTTVFAGETSAYTFSRNGIYIINYNGRNIKVCVTCIK